MDLKKLKKKLKNEKKKLKILLEDSITNGILKKIFEVELENVNKKIKNTNEKLKREKESMIDGIAKLLGDTGKLSVKQWKALKRIKGDFGVFDTKSKQIRITELQFDRLMKSQKISDINTFFIRP